ncbi:hypothetical protein LCGC14_2415520, partial [marine sediment metagenome]
MNPYLIDKLPPKRVYSWVLTCDPNKRHGGLLTAIDHLGNRFYVAEHYQEDVPDRVHAEAYHVMLNARKLRPQDVSMFADPGGAGAQAIVNLSDHGIYCRAVKKDAGSVKTSIEVIRRAATPDPMHSHPTAKTDDGKPVMGAPYTYFLTSLHSEWEADGVEFRESRLMWELRQYRQKLKMPPDTPLKEKDDLVDCMRYVELVRPFTPAPADTRVE